MKGVALYGEDFFIIKEDLELKKENITRILLTSPGERVNNLEFGSPLKDYIFEQESIIRIDLIERIKTAIQRWEPRVKVNDLRLEESTLNSGINTIKVEIDLLDTDTLIEFTYDTLIKY
jgi:phage baseplate assembly protein W